MTFSCCVFRSILLSYFSSFFVICWPSGSQKGSKWVSLGDLEAANLVKVTHPGATMVPGWLPGTKKEQFWVTLVSFRYMLKCFLYDLVLVFVSVSLSVSVSVSMFLIKHCKYYSFTMFFEVLVNCLSLLCRHG